MDRSLWLVLALVVLVVLWKRSASHAHAVDTPSTPPAPPGFGTDHAAPPPDPSWMEQQAVMSLKAARDAETAAANAKIEATNPAILAAKADPTVAASNAYYGQFIGKIT
jgi:hypothetical protein